VVSSVVRVNVVRVNRQRIAGDFGGMRNVVDSVMPSSGVLSRGLRASPLRQVGSDLSADLRARSGSDLSADLRARSGSVLSADMRMRPGSVLSRRIPADRSGHPSRVRSSEQTGVASGLSVVRSDVLMRDQVVVRRVLGSRVGGALMVIGRVVAGRRGLMSLGPGFLVVRVSLPVGDDQRETVECGGCGFWWLSGAGLILTGRLAAADDSGTRRTTGSGAGSFGRRPGNGICAGGI
jgi:hypothetical protein